jgi:hypothetical protein
VCEGVGEDCRDLSGEAEADVRRSLVLMLGEGLEERSGDEEPYE